jgi:hypothetical protein
MLGLRAAGILVHAYALHLVSFAAEKRHETLAAANMGTPTVIMVVLLPRASDLLDGRDPIAVSAL